MKSKTSITLSADLLEQIDGAAAGEPRSAFIERVLRDYFRRRKRAELHARDRERLDAGVDDLNAEAADVAEYQPWPED